VFFIIGTDVTYIGCKLFYNHAPSKTQFGELERFSLEGGKIIGFGLTTLRDWLNLKTRPAQPFFIQKEYGKINNK